MSGKVDKAPWGDSKHDGDITCIAFHNGFIYTGGADGRLKVWTQDLALKNTLDIHDVLVYTLAVTASGKLYSSSCDGVVKCTVNPVENEKVKELLKSENAIQSMYCVGETLYTGDDKGVVTIWENDKILYKFNLIEEVKSLAIEKNHIYTARDLDAVVSEIIAGDSGKYTTKATIPGRAPLCLLGPTIDGRKSYLAFSTRDGKGIVLTNNLPGQKYAVLWTKENCHSLIINAICGNETTLFTAGYDGRVKRWINIDKQPQESGEVDLLNCVNAICCGPTENTVFTGTSDGVPRRLKYET